MSFSYGGDKSHNPWKVVQDGKRLSEHRHYDQAEAAAKKVNADKVVYLNNRGFSVTVWPLGPSKPTTETVTPDTAYM